MRKSDIQYRNGHPCINIKVPWMRLETAVEKAHEDVNYPPTFTAEWIEDNVSEDRLSAIFWNVCDPSTSTSKSTHVRSSLTCGSLSRVGRVVGR